MLEQFDQNKSSRTQADLNLELQAAQNGDKEVYQKIYSSLVGSLFNWPNRRASHHVHSQLNFLSRHTNAPTDQLWLCAKRHLNYPQGSNGLKLAYSGEASYNLVG